MVPYLILQSSTLYIPGVKMISQPEILRDRQEARVEDHGVTIRGSSLFSHYELYRTFRNILSATAYTFLYAVINESHSTAQYSRALPEGGTIVLEIRIDKVLHSREYEFLAKLCPARDIDSGVLHWDRLFIVGVFKSCWGLTLGAPDREFQ